MYFCVIVVLSSFPREATLLPVLDPERATMPRSVLRYRPLATDDQARPGTPVVRPRRSRPDARAIAAPAEPDELAEEDDRPPRRAPAVRKPPTPAHQRRRRHPLLWVLLGLLLATAIWIGCSQLVAWGTAELNDLRYGTPRTYQTDAFVGQGDSQAHPSHFIALNLHGNIVILEFIGGDPAKTHEFEVASGLGPDADRTVVTLKFVDVNHNGHPDMLVEAGGVQSILVNDGTTFRPPTPGEQQQILEVLQQENQ